MTQISSGESTREIASYDVGVILEDEPDSPRFVPSLEEIREACAEIRAGWSDAERERRYVGRGRVEVDLSRVKMVGE